MKLLIILFLVLGTAYRLLLNIVQQRSATNPIPENVADVYDAQTYSKWRRYSGETCRLNIFSTILNFLATLALLCTDAFAAFAFYFPSDPIWQIMAVVLLDNLVGSLIGVGIDYFRTMIIEDKYGFNRTTTKTFVIDQIRKLFFEIVTSYALAYSLSILHESLSSYMIPLFAVSFFIGTLVISFLHPYISRMNNKFIPLEDGELKNSLMALLHKHGYRVRAIEVMDASRRTSKLNAYFTGFGKTKTIVLFDNLINVMTPEEVCAVFAHELGHGLHKDILKMQILNFGNLFVMGFVAWLAVCDPGLYQAFGFNEINYGFGIILLGIGLGLFQPICSMIRNAYSRRAEFRADRQALEEGYGDAMISALKKLAKENFAHLSPSPINVILEYSHPPLAQRIDNIDKFSKKP